MKKSPLVFALLSSAVCLLCSSATAQTPPQNWLFDTGRDYPASGTQPAIGYDNTVYFNCNDQRLYAINPNGTLKWKFALGYSSSPAIGIDGTIYCGSANRYFYAVTPSGTLKWKFLTGGNCSPPALASDGTIYFASDDGKFYALYPDGTKKWDYLIGANNASTPAAIGPDGTIYIGTYDYLFSFTPEGSKKWQYNCGNVGSAAGIDTNGVIYFSAQTGNYNYLCALYPTGSLKWTYPLGYGAGAAQSAPAIDASGNIYLHHNYTVFCLRSNGTTVWTVPLALADASSPAICSDGTIIVGGRDFYYGLNPDGSTKWQFPIGQNCNGGATVSPNGDIFFGNDQRVYSLAGGVPPASSAWPMYQKTSRHIGRYDLDTAGPPVISLQPVNQTAILNSATYFYASAGGTPPLSFQWYKDTNAVSGATNSILRLFSVSLSDDGIYSLVVSNSLGSTNTIPVTLTISPGMALDLYAGLTIQGQVGAACLIEYSYNLSNTNNWQFLTNFTLPTPTYFWMDPTPARSQTRFYRAFLTP